MTTPDPSEESLSGECEHGERAVDCLQCAADRLREINEKYDERNPWWSR